MSHTISDVTVTSSPTTDADFLKALQTDGPVGYTPFQNFVPGDYNYKSALFRIGMTSTSGDRGVINRLALTVDVPDIFDRGDQIIAQAGVQRIQFNRNFHVPPIVVLTVQSASDACTAKLVDGSVTKEYFDCYLERTSDKAKIVGALTWAAHAY
jgi:hypothetical protein